MNGFTDEEIEEFEEQLEDTDVVALLLQQNAYLDAILRELRGVEQEGETTPMFRCVKCNDVVESQNRQSHLESSHNAPKGVDVTNGFERVE